MSDYSMVERVKLLREASSVNRLHQKKTIQDYTVGQHSFDMLTLLLTIWPDASRDVILEVIAHDLPERLTGDVPHPAKAAGLVNGSVEERLEDRFWKATGFPVNSGLSQEDGWKLKFVDLLELYLFCLDEVQMGNTKVETVMAKIEKIFASVEMPEVARQFWSQVSTSEWNDMPEADEI